MDRKVIKLLDCWVSFGMFRAGQTGPVTVRHTAEVLKSHHGFCRLVRVPMGDRYFQDLCDVIEKSMVRQFGSLKNFRSKR